MGKIKQSNDERLLKKRLAEKKRQERIKNDPGRLLQEKFKRHAKYERQKKTGIVKPVSKMTTREQRFTRKKWKESSKRYRKNKQNSSGQSCPYIPPDEADDPPEPAPGPSNSTTTLNANKKISAGRRKVRRDRAKAYLHISKLKHDLENSKREANKYKKRYYRLRCNNENKSNDLTPHSKASKLLRGKKVLNEVRKRLIFGNVLEKQLKDSYDLIKSAKSKQLFVKLLSGKVIKKYRCLNNSKTFLKYKCFVANQNRTDLIYERKVKGEAIKLQESIIKFLEKDENSRLCPGKKDCITRLGVKKQKRLLSESVKMLHERYGTEGPYKVCYATFYKYRPFWVVQPSVDKRDTCLCVTHENMKLITEKLFSLKVLETKHPQYIIKKITCDSEGRENCMLRKCVECKDNAVVLTCNELDCNEITSYKKWVTKNEERQVKGKSVVVKVTTKEDIPVTISEMVCAFKLCVPKFMTHEGNAIHQLNILREIKDCLSENAVLFHIDFSENYNLKYSKETQAMHFGASRTQITLHTGVYYLNSNNVTTATAFCSLSKSLRHDPVAVWAHLKPILENVMASKIINEVYFYSDSPTTQYRNKTNFYLMSKVLPTISTNVRLICWNFSEAGHGKGAPDGIGGVLKRTADRIVAEGKDLPTFEHLFVALNKECPGILLFEITSAFIDSIHSKFLSEKTLIPFKGTMKVHQVIHSSNEPETLHFRSLSCLCPTYEGCTHGYYLGSQKMNDQFTTDKSKCSDSAKKTQDIITNIQPGEWVVVSYEGKPYPGEVLAISEHACEVNVMVPATDSTFKWPPKKDIFSYAFHNAKKKIGHPVPCGNRASQFTFRDFPF